jgi:hypothetical protein
MREFHHRPKLSRQNHRVLTVPSTFSNDPQSHADASISRKQTNAVTGEMFEDLTKPRSRKLPSPESLPDRCIEISKNSPATKEDMEAQSTGVFCLSADWPQ